MSAEEVRKPAANTDDLVIRPGLSIVASELAWRYTASGGPGGQHANTSNTKATVTFDIAGSASLDDATREALIDKLGSSITVWASEERSQLRNRNLAIKRLKERLAEALVVLPPRTPTRTPRRAHERRLTTKSANSARKSDRRARYSRDD